ncbi:MAG: hypothetical protein DI598_01115 [Pseudopedobacter saltans]|uniref:Type VI secretion system needle protein Hcp n=1 Tax=Pseudopedobacter saltans TaxID=151895 RepID=A0A2W5H2K2_9SPHI|nr:MAG: hypothetical protein DI598_01115 [Pseudopedobacter saltans]
MPFLAKLSVEDQTSNVLFCSFRFTQVTDEIGKPSTVPRGGSITLTVESTGNVSLFDWMISPTQMKSGTITFYRRDAMSKLKELSFTDAHCVDYQETFNSTGEFPMQIDIVLSAKKLSLNGSDFENKWSE